MGVGDEISYSRLMALIIQSRLLVAYKSKINGCLFFTLRGGLK